MRRLSAGDLDTGADETPATKHSKVARPTVALERTNMIELEGIGGDGFSEGMIGYCNFTGGAGN